MKTICLTIEHEKTQFDVVFASQCSAGDCGLSGELQRSASLSIARPVFRGVRNMSENCYI